ncbi:hypothetical protein WN944_010877 [Citrus x changshan-huyou]|uniref:Uncharacterized protein n=1 Tax=Citrus x changshan-huyou TaxID=2935761 RepID=A0AAP0MYT7_9ROSI
MVKRIGKPGDTVAFQEALMDSDLADLGYMGNFLHGRIGERSALIFLLAIIVWTTNRPMEYNYDDELIALRQQIQQPLIKRPTPPEQLRLLLVPLINVLAEMILGVPIREKIRA